MVRGAEEAAHDGLRVLLLGQWRRGVLNNVVSDLEWSCAFHSTLGRTLHTITSSSQPCGTMAGSIGYLGCNFNYLRSGDE